MRARARMSFACSRLWQAVGSLLFQSPRWHGCTDLPRVFKVVTTRITGFCNQLTKCLSTTYHTRPTAAAAVLPYNQSHPGHPYRSMTANTQCNRSLITHTHTHTAILKPDCFWLMIFFLTVVFEIWNLPNTV